MLKLIMALPHQSSSDEESGESEGSTSLPQSKLSYREGIGVGEGSSQGKHSRPQGRPTAPPPSQKLLLQHQESRKRASVLQLRYKKRVSFNVLNFPILIWTTGRGSIHVKEMINNLNIHLSSVRNLHPYYVFTLIWTYFCDFLFIFYYN